MKVLKSQKLESTDNTDNLNKYIRERKTGTYMKKKKNIILVCVLFILLICIGAFFLFNKTDKPNILKEPLENSMYDYIMETMYASQDGYSVDNIPPYGRQIYIDIAKEKMPNGNGWFYDEERNVFYRGYLQRLVLDFENNKAWNEKIDEYDPLEENDNRDATYTKGAEWDFSNRVYIDSDGTETKFKDELDSYAFDEKGEYIWNEDGTHKMKMYSDYFIKDFPLEDAMRLMPDYRTLLTAHNYHIEKMMYLYNKHFEELGCPLYGKSADDLKQYKKVAYPENIEPKKKSDKLNAPWELDYYTWDAAKDGRAEYLDDVNDIWDVEIPVSKTYSKSDDPGSIKNIFAKYVFFIKDNIGERYDINSEYRMAQTANGGFYQTLPQALLEYCYKPALNKLYGYNTIFYYNYDLVAKDHSEERSVTPTVEEYKNKNFNFSGSSIGDCLVIDDSDTKIGTDIRGELVTSQFFDNYISLLDDYGYSDKYTRDDFPFTDDYFFNFLCLYSYDYQNSMGLR